MSDSHNTAPDRTTTFDRLRAIVEGGHLARMTELEAKALLVYVTHADYATGEAFPSMGSVAVRAGTANLTRVRAAVRRLIDRGVLSEVQSSRGRLVTVRRVEAPAPLPEPWMTPKPPRRQAPSTGTVSVPVGTGKAGVVSAGSEANRDGERPGRSTTPTGTVNDPNRDGKRPSTGTVSVPRTPENTSKNTSENTHRGAARGRDGDVIPDVPEALRAPDFLAAWERWQRHRRQIHKRLTAEAVTQQFVKLVEWGPARATAAIDHSIACSWTGIFEAKGVTRADFNRKPAPPSPAGGFSQPAPRLRRLNSAETLAG